MKKLCIHILIILSLMLSACAQATPDTPKGEGVHKTENTQESTVGSDTSGTAVLIEAEEKVEPIIVEALGTKTAADFIGEAVTQKLSANGYTAAIHHIKIYRSNVIDYSLLVTDSKGKQHIIENLTAVADLTYGIESLQHSLQNLYIKGVSAAVYDDTLFLSGDNRMRFFDLATMEEQKSPVVFDVDEQITFHSVLQHGDGFMASCHIGDEWNLIIADGTNDIEILPANLKNEYKDYNSIGGKLKLRGSDGRYVFISSYYCYDTEEQLMYNVLNSLVHEHYSEFFYFEKWVAMSEGGKDHYKLTSLKDNEITEINTFYGLEVSEVFGVCQETNNFGDRVEFSFTDNNREVTLSCPDSQADIILDRETNSGQVVYYPDARQINFNIEPIRSKDQRYSIYSGARAGGGDYSVAQMILHDSDTRNKYNMYHYIGTVGGMYGGNEGIGFFSNNDIYIIRLDEFLVFEEGMAQQQPKFTMSKNFPLGKVDEGNITYRYLYAARRDPVKFDYIVLYADFTHTEHVTELGIDKDGFILGPTYKIGFLDTEGRLTRSIDTGINVQWDYFGFRPVEMYKEGDNSIHFKVMRKSTVCAEAVVNLDSGTTEIIDICPWEPK